MYRVMVVEDDELLAGNINAYLARDGWDVMVLPTVERALEMLEVLRPDAIVADYMLPGRNGLELLKEVMAVDPQVKVVMTTGHGDIPLAVEAMKSGAYDYLCKPLVLAELKLLLERALHATRMEKTLSFFHSNQARDSGLKNMLGSSPAFLEIRDKVAQIVAMEARITDGMLPAVLVTGETGTGKELVARALHFDGPRHEGPFIEVNCASLPAQLLESELFGHERGAFTDAKERKIGLVEAAEGGTLFLDEIGEVDLSIQAKLLKLLEERTVRRLGSTRERRVDVRIVSATNQDLERMVREGRFRSDLYFRLRIVSLHLPPLRERAQDVLMLARHFVALHARRYGKAGIELSAEAQCALLAHSWPGNVRELKNVLEQAVLLAHDGVVRCEDLALTATSLDEPAHPPRRPDGVPMRISGDCVTLPEVERQLVMRVLEQTGWNVSRAASLLGISRDMLRSRIEKYRLARPEK